MGVWMMARSGLRRRGRGVVAMGLVLGLAGGFALTAAVGARRSATSWDRLATATDAPDAVVTATGLAAGAETLRAARATPGVRAATGLHWLPVGLEGAAPDDVAAFVALDASFGRDLYRPRVLAGRLADQSQPGELMVNRALSSLGHLRVGDRLPALALAPGLAPTDAVDQEVEVVGIVEGFFDLGSDTDKPYLYLTAAFRDRWLGAVAEPWGGDALTGSGLETPVFVGVEPGADPGDVADAVVAASPPGATAQVGTLDPDVGTTIGYATWAYALLAAGAAVATTVAGAQAMGRLVQPQAGEHEVWRALGAPPRDRTAALAVPGVLAGGLATVVAVAGAVVASPLVPTGFPRRIEVDPGVWVSPLVLVPGGLLLAGVLGAAAAWLASRAQDPTRARRTVPGPSWLTIGSPARTLGVRASLGWGTDAAARRRARSAVAATALAVLGIGAVTLVVASSRTTLDSPRAWGFGFDRIVILGDLTGTDPAAVEGQVADDAGVAGLSAVHTSEATVEGEALEVQEIEPRRGSALPVLLDGRAPLAADELVLGPLALRDHGLEVGDEVSLADGTPPVRIVGTAVIPAQEGGEFGSVAWLGPGGLERVGLDAGGDYLYVTATPGTPVEHLDRIPGATEPFRPGKLSNLRQVGAAPYVLAGFLALLGLASLAHALLLAVRSRRHELAVVRSLGFVGQQVRRTIVWQAATTAVVGLAVGAPLGVVAGTWTWRQLASSLGTADRVTVPVLALALVPAGCLLAAYLVALGPARRAGHQRAADILRAE